LQRRAIDRLAAGDAGEGQALSFIAWVKVEEPAPSRIVDENERRRRPHDRRVSGVPGDHGVVGFGCAQCRVERGHAPPQGGRIADREVGFAAGAAVPSPQEACPSGFDLRQRSDWADPMAKLAQRLDHRLGRARPGLLGRRIKAPDDGEMQRGPRRFEIGRARRRATRASHELDG